MRRFAMMCSLGTIPGGKWAVRAALVLAVMLLTCAPASADSAIVAFKTTEVRVWESAGHATFIVVLDQPFDGTATVQYATVDGTAVAGTDYTAVSGTLIFAPG